VAKKGIAKNDLARTITCKTRSDRTGYDYLVTGFLTPVG
jgi:hypothetical protein